MRVRTAAPVLLLVLVSGCAAGVEEAAPRSAAEAPSTTPASPDAVASAPASPSPPPAVRTVAVTYAGGRVTGTSGREEVALGERFVLRLISDVPERVHVHGYDLEQDLPAGVPVDIPITASIPGVFEVELHEAGRALLQLRVA